MYDILLITWLSVLTLYVLITRKGIEGEKGERGDSMEPSEWEIRPVLTEMLDDAEYIAKLIKKLNSLQLSSGTKVNKD